MLFWNARYFEILLHGTYKHPERNFSKIFKYEKLVNVTLAVATFDCRHFHKRIENLYLWTVSNLRCPRLIKNIYNHGNKKSSQGAVRNRLSKWRHRTAMTSMWKRSEDFGLQSHQHLRPVQSRNSGLQSYHSYVLGLTKWEKISNPGITSCRTYRQQQKGCN